MKRTPEDFNLIDFALLAQAGAWLRHPVLGDPSFDACERLPGNPVVRGSPPFEWPVNGFLFTDPQSGHWYLYVGHYARGYALEGGAVSHCTVLRSTDRGRSWTDLGTVFPDEPFTFTGSAAPVTHAPDVSVAWWDGRYHMAFDWVAADASWQDFRESGVGYAWSERPEGPFQRHPQPIFKNTAFVERPILGKYRRLYATTLIRRKTDWLVLAIMDSQEHFAWGLAAATAAKPEGPYSAPIPLFHTEGEGFHPVPLEHFPAFVQAGHIYAPATSVALNRDFQVIWRAEIEAAHLPGAWELWQHGSAWHSEPLENEAAGLWGQTFSGIVDAGGRLTLMFPSRDREGCGTINLAGRSWDEPHRRRGFRLNAPNGPAFTCLRHGYASFELEAELRASGTVTIQWGREGPLGRDKPSADASLHPLMATGGYGLELSAETWRLLRIANTGRVEILASGALAGTPPSRVALAHAEDGTVRIKLDGVPAWEGRLDLRQGGLGLRLEKGSFLAVERFAVRGSPLVGALPLLYTEALAGAGQRLQDWEELSSPVFRYGVGAALRGEGGRAKWNFSGSGFELWAPCGPDGAVVEVSCDGIRLAELDLRAEQEVPSGPVWRVDDLPDGLHAVTLRALRGRLVVDTLVALTKP